MKTWVKLLAFVLAGGGIILAWLGLTTLLYYGSFTETTQGTVVKREGKEVVIRFHETRSSPAPQKVQFSGVAEYAFPFDERTENLQVGDKVEAYHPPGKLSEVRLDKDFSYLGPVGLVGAGAVLNLAFVLVLLLPRRKKSL